MQITTIGLDIAKNVYQVHGIDAAEKVVVRKQLRRSQVLGFFKALPPCLVGIESQGVAEAGHRLAEALTIAHAVWPLACAIPWSRPRERALTRSLRDHAPV